MIDLGCSTGRKQMSLGMRHLRLIKLISETHNLTRAAQRLHLTQSAASHQLRKAEMSLGVKLFNRAGKNMTPTEPGRRIIAMAGQVLELVDGVQLEITKSACSGKPLHDCVISSQETMGQDKGPLAT